MKKKIVIIVNEVLILLYFRKELVFDFVKEGYEVFCLVEGYEVFIKEIIVSWGVKLVEYNLKRSNFNFLVDIIEVFKFRKVLKEIVLDIVLICFVKFVIFVFLVVKLVGIKKWVGMIEGLGYVFIFFIEKKGLKVKIIKFL